jgi:hypothetical protein
LSQSQLSQSQLSQSQNWPYCRFLSTLAQSFGEKA